MLAKAQSLCSALDLPDKKFARFIQYAILFHSASWAELNSLQGKDCCGISEKRKTVNRLNGVDYESL